MKRIVFVFALLAMYGEIASGQTYKVLYNFGASGSGDGTFAFSHLVADKSGNLYGLTGEGGANDGGTIFELSPNSNGSWSETTLYSFCAEVNGNTCPSGTFSSNGLAIDTAGNLYGTTPAGGLHCQVYGCGVAFELSPPSAPGGAWTYNVIYEFCAVGGEACLDGEFPGGATAVDKSGNVYSTTTTGGTTGAGIVYELSPVNGSWVETVLYNFCSVVQNSICVDGEEPEAGVTLDASGNLYGTTAVGGTTGPKAAGTLYKLEPSSNGWVETVLGTFAARSNLAYPGPASVDAAGNVYATQLQGGIYGKKGISYGAVDMVSAAGKIRHFFFDDTDGDGPWTGVMVDPHRHLLYGTTGNSGFNNNYFSGNIYQIDEAGEETVLYAFCSQPGCTDGEYPQGVIEDSSGNLYGVANQGGENGTGVVFEFTP